MKEKKKITCCAECEFFDHAAVLGRSFCNGDEPFPLKDEEIYAGFSKKCPLGLGEKNETT